MKCVFYLKIWYGLVGACITNYKIPCNYRERNCKGTEIIWLYSLKLEIKNSESLFFKFTHGNNHDLYEIEIDNRLDLYKYIEHGFASWRRLSLLFYLGVNLNCILWLMISCLIFRPSNLLRLPHAIRLMQTSSSALR